MSKILDYYSIDPASFRYISHHGILGMKWGIRRYQNFDGSLTDVGRKHYKSASSYENKLNRADKKRARLLVKYSNSSFRTGKHSFKSLKYKRQVDAGEAFVKKIVDLAANDGYTVIHLPSYQKIGKSFVYSKHRYLVD